MDVRFTCNKCDHVTVKEPRMYPHFMKLSTLCGGCGAKVYSDEQYRPGYEVNKLPKKRKNHPKRKTDPENGGGSE